MSPDSGYLSVVHAHALRDPDAVAFEIADGGRSTVLTYGGLVERAQRLGEALRRAGFRDGACVALCMENRPAWPVAYLAVWYAGGITVPLDPALDEDVLARLLGHSGAVACFTSETLSTKLRAACATMTSPPLLLCPDRQGDEPVAFASWDGEPEQGSATSGPSSDNVDAETAAIPDLELLASFDAFVDQHGSEASDWRPALADDETLGSIMYTSGTTGDPKGVMIRQRAVLENLRAGVARVHFSPADRILGILPLFHVLPLITNCLGPLYVGARVVFLYELTAESIMDAFRRHDITVFVCVPAFFYRFHDRVTGAIDNAPGMRRRIARLLLTVSRSARRRFGWSLGRWLLRRVHAPFGRRMRLFITGGAKMNAQIYEDFLDWGFCMAQGYGLTEATAIISATPLDELRGDSVGKPIDGVRVRIHEPDEEGIGEVWATGPSIMSGYFRNAEATADVLEGEWLRTGDLGRLLPDGHLQITGRAKDVIVLSSGKNIYPDELEGYYGQSELIDEICVLGIPDEAGKGERLHAVVVPDLEAARRRGYVNVREMIMWELEGMGAKLPGPQRLTSLEMRAEPLPRTPSRKIRRFVLQQELAARGPADQPDDDSSGLAAPTDLGELPEWAPAVIEVVARYAKRARVEPTAHLDIDLGLESLDRIEMLAELQRSLGVTVDEETVGRVHTVAELIAALDAAPSQDGTARAIDAAAPAAVADNWDAVLRRAPTGIDAYLGRRPLVEPFMWLLLRLCRGLWRLIAGFRVDGVGEVPQEGPFLLCANHSSYLDPFFLCMALPRSALSRVFFVGYAEYFEGAIGSRLGRLVRNVPIDPNANLERAMQAAAEGLRRGMILVIFPEGARSIDGSVREFRRGAGILANHLGVPIVPAGIWGAHRVWPRQGKKQRHPVGLCFGAALSPRDDGDDGALVDGLRARVIELVERARALCPPGAAV
ncbi:MAG: AMP-binding protein [Acidobacteriota bacterium]|jgi:long-chain acyl-CoA synthetase